MKKMFLGMALVVILGNNVYGMIQLETETGTTGIKEVGALFKAVENDDIKSVEDGFIFRGANPNMKNKKHFTPLMIASWRGNAEIIRILLEAGADVNKTGKYGNTPLICAINSGHKEIVRLLLRAGADVNKANSYGYGFTPLNLAVNFEYTEIAEILIKEGGARIPTENSEVIKKLKTWNLV